MAGHDMQREKIKWSEVRPGDLLVWRGHFGQSINVGWLVISIQDEDTKNLIMKALCLWSMGSTNVRGKMSDFICEKMASPTRGWTVEVRVDV